MMFTKVFTMTKSKLSNQLKKLVGERRFELPASWSRTKRATKLRYSPTNF